MTPAWTLTNWSTADQYGGEHGARANVSIVDGTAAQILVSKSWKPPANALQDLLDQKIPPPVTIPGAPAVPPSPRPAPIPPGAGGLTPPASPGRGGSTPPGTPPLDGGGLQPTPVTPPRLGSRVDRSR